MLVQKNIWKLYVLFAALGAQFYMPVILPFWRQNDLNLVQIFFLLSVFSTSTLLWEIPSGYIADIWGKKNTLVLGSMASFIGFTIYSLSHDFWIFFIAEIFLGMGTSFFSGALEALLYETLEKLKRDNAYRSTLGHASFLEYSSEAISSILGGFIALYSLRATMAITVIPYAIAVLTALSLKEVNIEHQDEENKNHLREILSTCKYAFLQKPVLRNLILIGSLIYTITTILLWIAQDYQQFVGVPLFWFGLISASLSLATGFGSKYSHALEKKYNDKLLIIISCLAIGLATILIGFTTSLAGITLFLVIRLLWGFFDTLTTDISNKHALPRYRATILSMRSFFFRLCFSILSPMFGYAADILTLNQALLLTGTIGTAAILVSFAIFGKHWKDIHES